MNEDFEEDILLVKNRDLTGAAFLITNCDEKFTTGDLNDLGNDFASDYYGFSEESDFAKQYASYLQDYEEVLARTVPDNNLYKVEDSWINYDLIRPVIDKRFLEWKQYIK